MGFVFFDVETTGTDRRYDQILQFAAILTDGELVEQDRAEFGCRLLPHVVPAPGALLATRQSIRSITDPSLPSHYEMMVAVARQLEAWSPAVFAGWNSIAFDEEMLRQALFQSLHPPYLTSLHGNGRVDVMRAARAATLLAPGALTMARRSDGRSTFTLEAFARANGVAHSSPHQAISDVEATLGIASAIEQRAPEAWSAVLRFCRKAPVADLLADGTPLGLVDVDGGEPVILPVVALGVDPGRANAFLVQDLRHDPVAIPLKERDARPSWSLPSYLRRIAANGCPVLLSLDQLDWPGEWPDETTVAARADAAIADRSAVGRLLVEHAWSAPPASEHVERRLHGGFYGPSDLERLRDFHGADWASRTDLINSFDDGRLRRLARRLVLQHAPERLPDDQRERMEAASADRLRANGVDGREWRTLAQADAEAVQLAGASDAAGREILDEFRTWLAARPEKSSDHLHGSS